jgi:TetR/AcrR family transcriptional regulator
MEIRDAALRVFAEHGYEGTSMRELARELGVSHNLIPQRLGSKEELWYQSIDQGFGRLSVELWTVLQDPPGDAIGRLRSMVQRFIEANAAHPSLLRIINQEATSPGPRLDYLFENFISPMREFGDAVLSSLAAEGKVRTTSVSLFYFLMVHGAGGPFSLGPLAERFGEVIDPNDADAVSRHAAEAVAVLFDGLIAGDD